MNEIYYLKTRGKSGKINRVIAATGQAGKAGWVDSAGGRRGKE